MKHTNPNMVAPVLEGIVLGEQAAQDHGDWVLAAYYGIIDECMPRLGAPTGQFLLAKHIAVAQGFIAAYRAAELPKRCRSGHTDCTVDCGWCKGKGMHR